MTNYVYGQLSVTFTVDPVEIKLSIVISTQPSVIAKPKLMLDK